MPSKVRKSIVRSAPKEVLVGGRGGGDRERENSLVEMALASGRWALVEKGVGGQIRRS
ncbi:hypothetical protein A2U01_0046532, partial [Trifolium medium]|nr:hypothetical protein [Trifolium medium]